jgi:hypothetical protein
LSAPAWADEFLAYKDLKTLLKVFGRNPSAAAAAGQAPPSGDELVAYLAACPYETAFFARLHVELGKVATFYGQVEEQLAQRYKQLLVDFEEIAGSAAELALATQVGDPLSGVSKEVGGPSRARQPHQPPARPQPTLSTCAVEDSAKPRNSSLATSCIRALLLLPWCRRWRLTTHVYLALRPVEKRLVLEMWR